MQRPKPMSPWEVEMNTVTSAVTQVLSTSPLTDQAKCLAAFVAVIAHVRVHDVQGGVEAIFHEALRASPVIDRSRRTISLPGGEVRDVKC
jgi:hypothetical protein